MLFITILGPHVDVQTIDHTVIVLKERTNKRRLLSNPTSAQLAPRSDYYTTMVLLIYRQSSFCSPVDHIFPIQSAVHKCFFSLERCQAETEICISIMVEFILVFFLSRTGASSNQTEIGSYTTDEIFHVNLM